MKTKFPVTLGLLFLSLSLNAQFILVGQHSANDYYFNIPDTTIRSTCRDGLEPEFPVDLNGDGTVDFKFLLYCWDAGMDKGGYMKLLPLNGNQIIYDHTDTCSSNLKGRYIIAMAKSMSLNDTINNNYIWSSCVLYLFFKEWAPYSGYNCYFSSNFTYAGVRLITPSDTLHGWIGFSVTPAINDYQISIYEWACNIDPHVNVQEHNAITKIYPNPGNGVFTLELCNLTGNVSFEIFSLEGKPVSEKYFYNVSQGSSMRLDLSDLKKGLYFLKISSNERTGYEKILIL